MSAFDRAFYFIMGLFGVRFVSISEIKMPNPPPVPPPMTYEQIRQKRVERFGPCQKER